MIQINNTFRTEFSKIGKMTSMENLKDSDSRHISVIILNWNGWRDTLECLESVFQTTYNDYSVILVDNGSSDDSLQKIRDYCQGLIEIQSPFISYTLENKPVHLVELDEELPEKSDIRGLQENGGRKLFLVKNKKNYGYAKGNNIGIRAALKFFNPGYILILNNDIIAHEATLFSHLVEGVNRDGSAGLVSPVLHSCSGEIQRVCTRNFPEFLDYLFIYSFLGQKIFPNNRRREKHFNLSYTFDKARQFDVLGGSCLLFKSEALTRIGLFDENTFLYWEEFIIGKKLQLLGINSFILPDTSVIHKGEVTINNLNLKSWARFWSTQSELYYINTYAPLTRVKRSIVIIVLLIEAVLGWGISVFSKGIKKFDSICEKKIVKFLLKSF